MAYHLCPILQEQQFDQNGVVLVGGKIYFYLAGTTTPTPIYSDDAGTVQSNPVILNSRGAPDFPIWFNDTISYKAVLKSPLDAFIAQWDDLSGVNNATSSTLGIEWTASAMTPTYLSTTQFSVTGDQTPTLQVGRRLRCVVSAGTIYGTITASSYAAGNTTVTFAGDSSVLDSGLSSFSYGTLAPTNSSIPKTYTDGWGGTASGAVNAYAINVSPAIGAYAAGQTFRFIPNLTNTTTTPTLNVNGLGAKTIKSRSIAGLAAVPVGAIYIGQEFAVTYDGTYFVIDVASSAAGTQTFNYTGVDQTFSVPGCNFVRVICVGGGGGGGSGARGAAGTDRVGGGGGGGGERIERIFSVSEIGGSGASITVHIGAGGIAGPGRTTDNVSGIAGGDADDTYFGTLLYAKGGIGGSGSSGGNGGHYIASQPFGGVGGTSAAGGAGYWGGGGGGAGDGSTYGVGKAGGASEYGASGGAGGGSITSGNVASNGGKGGYITVGGMAVFPTGTEGDGGTSGAINGVAGGNYSPLNVGSGGGGGYANGGNGGAGAVPGGGGGGGGASLNGTTSGAGGAGGNGRVVVEWW